MTLRNTITLAFGIFGILWYYICLVVIGMNLIDPAQGEAGFRDFMSVSITTIGVSLATFVGMILGLRGVSEGIRETAAASPEGKAADKLHILANLSAGTTLQWAAAGMYVLSLFLALFFWWHIGDKSDPAIINLGKSILGLVGGALSVLLNLPR